MAADESLRILLVDDDKDLLELLKYNFEKEGFVVKTVANSRTAIPKARKFQPHLIVLDVMMPRENGLDLCRKIRRESCFEDIPIFFLTARPESAWREAALQSGADDFVEKLNGIRALINKVSAVLKNKFVIKKGIDSLSSDRLVIDKPSQLLHFKDQQIVLSTPEFEILFFLMQNPGKIISLESLIKILWGSRTYVQDYSVERCIENLRRKIGEGRIEALQEHHYRFND